MYFLAITSIFTDFYVCSCILIDILSYIFVSILYFVYFLLKILGFTEYLIRTNRRNKMKIKS